MGMDRKFPSNTFKAIPTLPPLGFFIEMPRTDSPPIFVMPRPAIASINKESKRFVPPTKTGFAHIASKTLFNSSVSPEANF